jgi:hypothetical protein
MEVKMATQKMVYGVAASSDTNPTPYKLKRVSTTPVPQPTLIKSVAPLKALGIVDFLQVVGDGAYPDSSFISDCAANHASCGINNSNDGTSSNWSLAYYQQLASSGVQWAIGESESGAEMCTIMQAAPGKLVAGTYGGEGTGGPTNNNDIWSGNTLTPTCTIKPGTINCWLEAYTSSAMLSASEIGTEAGINKDAGCFEVGLLPGTWCEADYGATAETYLEMVDAMKSQGVTCAGVQMWYYQGGFAYPDIFTDLMAEYPANMTPILQRASGTPTPTPTPPTPDPAVATQCFLTVDNANPKVNAPVTFTATVMSNGKEIPVPVTVYHYLNGIKYIDAPSKAVPNSFSTLTFKTTFTTADPRPYYMSFAGNGQFAPSNAPLGVNVQ